MNVVVLLVPSDSAERFRSQFSDDKSVLEFWILESDVLNSDISEV